MKLIVVGAGLFGRIAADYVQLRGLVDEVVLIDAKKPMRASAAAGCLIKPSWLSSIPSQEIRMGVDVLTELYGVHNVVLQNTLGMKFPVSHVDPDQILRAPDIVATVEEVSDGFVRCSDGSTHTGVVLVAAGIWCSELLGAAIPQVSALVGASARFKDVPKKVPDTIHVYAPYRQSVLFRMQSGEAWFGDGTGIVLKNWDEASRVQKSKERAAALVGGKKGVWTVGARPYVAGHKAGYFRKLSPRLFVSTGGAKNGVLLAAIQAVKLAEELIKKC